MTTNPNNDKGESKGEDSPGIADQAASGGLSRGTDLPGISDQAAEGSLSSYFAFPKGKGKAWPFMVLFLIAVVIVIIILAETGVIEAPTMVHPSSSNTNSSATSKLAASFAPTPSIIKAGESSTLNWAFTGGVRVAAGDLNSDELKVTFYEGDANTDPNLTKTGQGTLVVTKNGSKVVTPKVTTTYSLVIAGANNTYTGQAIVFTATVTVIPASPTLSTTTAVLTSSTNPSTVEQSVTFTATVSGTSGAAPTGTVNFYNGTTLLGTGTLNGSGVATISTRSLSIGTQTITATYNGDSTHSASTSPKVDQVINKG